MGYGSRLEFPCVGSKWIAVVESEKINEEARASTKSACSKNKARLSVVHPLLRRGHQLELRKNLHSRSFQLQVS